jgi:hypothetical protein
MAVSVVRLHNLPSLPGSAADFAKGGQEIVLITVVVDALWCCSS